MIRRRVLNLAFAALSIGFSANGVATAQTLTVTLSHVTDEFSQVLPDTPVSSTRPSATSAYRPI